LEQGADAMTGWAANAQRLMDESSPTPLYHQIFTALKEGIRRGEIADQSLLPNELQLAELFNVSRITMKRALAELAQAGLVVRRRGIGTVVHAPSAPKPLVHGSFDNWIENLDAFDRDVEVELLAAASEPADPVVAGHLRLEPGTLVQRVIRLRKIGGIPFAHVDAWVPATIAARYPSDALATTPMLVLLERAGIKPAEAEQWISAVPAPPDVIKAFGMTVPEPMLLLEQVMHDFDGAPVQFLRAHYHGERFRYNVRIGRNS
jgi:GntR family transcriptional regulator